MSVITKADTMTKTQLFRLVPVFSNPKNGSLWDLFSKKVLYHGTSEGRIGEQLHAGQFENIGRRIYGDSESAAIGYALRAAKADGTKPLVLKISSKVKPVLNEATDGGWSGLQSLGLYRYFAPGPDQNVKIESAYEVINHD